MLFKESIKMKKNLSLFILQKPSFRNGRILFSSQFDKRPLHRAISENHKIILFDG